MTDTPPPNEYALVIIDSTGEAMAAGGVNSNDDAEVARWFALAKQLTRLPGNPAVVVLDHVPKSTDAPSLYSIGSQRKRAAITGASYRVDTIKEPAKGRDGKLKLVVAKDRLGNRAKGTTAAIADITSNDDGVRIHLHVDDAQAAAEAGERFRPMVLMERVSRFIEENPGAPKRDIREGVKGKAAGIDIAVQVLTDEGWIVATHGAHRAVNYTSSTPYRDGMAAPDDCVPTVSQCVPDTVGHSQSPPSATVSRVPLPIGGHGTQSADGDEPQGAHSTGTTVSPSDDDPFSIF